jgi:geranylgeranyl pyrophosphate synthase
VKILNQYGSLEYARKKAKEFITTAIEALSGIEKSDAKDALIETAEFMVARAS